MSDGKCASRRVLRTFADARQAYPVRPTLRGKSLWTPLSKKAGMTSGEYDRASAYSCNQCGRVALDERRRQCCGEEMSPIETNAVSRPELKSLLPQVFDVSQRGIDIAVYLMDEGQATTDDIASDLDVNRTTVSRQLNQLRELGVVEYGEQSLKEGGRVHVYTPAPL